MKIVNDITPQQKKMLSALAMTMVMVIGLAIGTALVLKPTSFRQQASLTNVDLSLSGPTSVNVGQQFTVNVVVDRTNNHQVTAADFIVNHSSNVRLDSIAKGQYFATTNMAAPPPTNSYGWDAVGTQLYSNVTERRFAVGALCDYCYLGSTCTNPTGYPNACTILPRCSNTQAGSNPTCYPKTSTGQLATLTFTALSAGTATINFDTANTFVSSIGNDTDVAGDKTGISVNVTSTTPTACDADINQSGQVTITDYSILRNDYLRNPPLNPRSDINHDGQVTITDYSILRNFYLATCP